MDLANLVKPILTEGDDPAHRLHDLRGVQAHRAGPRARTAALQKIAVDEPNFEDEPSRSCEGLRSRYEQHHKVVYTDAALEAAVRLARRHLREHRLPDSAVDVIDEAGAALRLRLDRRTAAAVDVPEVERVVARMARIPEKQASVSEKERLRTLEESLHARRLRPGGGGPDGGRRRSSARARASAIPSTRPAASSSPAPRASARPSWRSSSPATSGTSSTAST